MFFQTKIMTYSEIAHFLRLYDSEIGTDRELDEVSPGFFSVTCMDLETKEEIDLCVKFEARSAGSKKSLTTVDEYDKVRSTSTITRT